MGTPDFSYIAAQLRHPQGEDGIATAHRMSDNNKNMIQSCIDAIGVEPGNSILEIGPGSGSHVPYLLKKSGSLTYRGIDISHTMVAMATENQKEFPAGYDISFQAANVKDGWAAYPFETGYFDKIFTVNTIYFWDNALQQAKEIYRVLKSGGTFILCYASEEFMRSLPFTSYGFHLYDKGKASALLEEAGFTIQAVHDFHEEVVSVTGGPIGRDFTIMQAAKL